MAKTISDASAATGELPLTSAVRKLLYLVEDRGLVSTVSISQPEAVALLELISQFDELAATAAAKDAPAAEAGGSVPAAEAT